MLDIEMLLATVQSGANPVCLIDSAVFLWQQSGDSTPPALIGDFNAWNPRLALPFLPLTADWYYCQLPAPADTYLEYAFVVGEQRVPDPLNAKRVLDNGMHRAEFNHYFGMPAYQPSVWLRANATDLAGRLQIEQLQGDMLVSGGTREVRFYHPPSDAPCPLLVVYDGPDYHERAALVQVVDNLITAGRIQPIALALLQNGGPARLLEYGCNDVTIGFLQEVVLPFAQQQGNLLDWRKQPGCYGVLGASMGGVMALYTGLRAPHIFGNVFAQAGAYSLPSYYAIDFDLVVYSLVENLTPPALHIWQDCGRFDFLLPTNRRMADLLRLRGYRHTYHEYSAGHNYTAWRDQLAAGLQLLFPSL